MHTQKVTTKYIILQQRKKYYETVLYRPVFINPQAYYVFPQLYDIEPRRNNIYKEQAIFAGRIDVYDVNSPDNVEHFENTREIDLNSFASRHIRIDQYTDLGAVVLGEWNLPSKIAN